MQTDFAASEKERISYRTQTQQMFASAAGSFGNQTVADYLYTLALRAGPSAAARDMRDGSIRRPNR